MRTVSALPKTTPTNLSRKCGTSKSATKIRSRRTSRPTKQRIRTITTYCSGGTRTAFTIRRSTLTITKTVNVPGPTITVPAAPAPAAKRLFRLTLLHNNDGESKYGVGDSIAGYGGVTRFKTVLDRLRAAADSYSTADERAGLEDKGTVVVSSGDNFLAGLNLRASFQRFDAGTGPFYDSLALDRIGYDAVTIGNHEYDFGPTRLAEFISGTTTGIPFLTANTDFRAEPVLQNLRNSGRIADSAVVRKGGQQIGIIGVTTPDVPNISSPGANVKFLTDVAGIVNAEVQRLTAAGVNKIILSSHLQNLDYEKGLVTQLRNVDVVISGGGDEVLANPSDVLVPVNGAAPPIAGPYPALATSADGASVPIVTTQGEYRYVGRLTVAFDGDGHLTATDATRSGPVRVSATVATPDYVADEDPVLKSTITDPLTAYKAVLAANVIGSTEVILDGATANIRTKETNLGDLVADGFVYAANRTAAAEGRAVANIGLSNGGGIRTSISPVGNINEKQTFDVLPFDNVIVTVPNLSAARLKELMEWGVSRYETADGKFPQISGFKLVVGPGTAQLQDTSGNVTTPGARVRSITLDDGTKLVENGAVVAGAPSVNLATTNFTAGGGDNYPFRKIAFQFAHVPNQGTLYPYQASLFDFLTATAPNGGLGGVVTAARYPVGGAGRITIQP